MTLVNWADVITKVVGFVVIGLIGACSHLWVRLGNLETNEAARKQADLVRAEADKARSEIDRITQEHYRSEVVLSTKSLANFHVLLAKIETLLETGIKRLDILEKHVFKL